MSRQNIRFTHKSITADIGETVVDYCRKSKREAICIRGDRRLRQLRLLAINTFARLRLLIASHSAQFRYPISSTVAGTLNLHLQTLLAPQQRADLVFIC